MREARQQNLGAGPGTTKAVPKWYAAELGRLQTDEARGSNEEGDVAPHERGPPRFNFFNGEFYKARDHITVTPHPSESHLISLHARSNCMRSSL